MHPERAIGSSVLRLLLYGLILILPAAVTAEFGDSDTIVERGQIDDDYYAAGGVIDIDAEIAGDVIVAGGELYIGGHVNGDVIAAGGLLDIRGRVDDDVRISGGDLNIDAQIGDDLAATGGSISLSPDSLVAGDVWLAGGEVHIAGTIVGNLKVLAGEIRLAGKVQGNVQLEGGEIEILDSAEIGGNLEYQSPHPAVPEDNAQVGGQVIHHENGYADRGFGLFFSLTLIAASILFYLLFPHYTRASVNRIRTDPWNSLGLGFIFLILTPLAAFMLMLIVLGFWVGLSLLALYGLALLAGFLIACFFVADRGAKLFKQDLDSRMRRLISVIIAIFVLGLLQAIPLLGGLLLFLLLLLGLGAGLMQLRYVYSPVEGSA